MEQFFNAFWQKLEIIGWRELVIIALVFLCVYLIYQIALTEKEQKSNGGQLFALELVERGQNPFLICFIEKDSKEIISAVDLAKFNQTSYAIDFDGTKFIKFYFINGSSPAFHKFKYKSDPEQTDTILQFSELDDGSIVGELSLNAQYSLNYGRMLSEFLQ